jgi:hypothetical protein
LLGWGFYFVLAWRIAHAKPEKRKQMRSLLIFQVTGLEGLKDELDTQAKDNLASGFNVWGQQFSRLIAYEKSAVLASYGDEHWKDMAKTMIHGWMISAIDELSLVFGTLTDQEQYRSRASLIVFGTAPPVTAKGDASAHDGEAAGDASAEIVGKHWIYYEGQLQPFLMKDFCDNSIGYQVLSRQKQSPYETNTQNMDVGQQRGGDDDRPFVTFWVNDHSILTVDWPGTIEGGVASASDPKNGEKTSDAKNGADTRDAKNENGSADPKSSKRKKKKKSASASNNEINPYISAAESIFNTYIIPAVKEVLDRWPHDLSSVVSLRALPSPLPIPGKVAGHGSQAHPAGATHPSAGGKHAGKSGDGSHGKAAVPAQAPATSAETPVG